MLTNIFKKKIQETRQIQEMKEKESSPLNQPDVPPPSAPPPSYGVEETPMVPAPSAPIEPTAPVLPTYAQGINQSGVASTTPVSLDATRQGQIVYVQQPGTAVQPTAVSFNVDSPKFKLKALENINCPECNSQTSTFIRKRSSEKGIITGLVGGFLITMITRGVIILILSLVLGCGKWYEINCDPDHQKLVEQKIRDYQIENDFYPCQSGNARTSDLDEQGQPVNTTYYVFSWNTEHDEDDVYQYWHLNELYQNPINSTEPPYITFLEETAEKTNSSLSLKGDHEVSRRDEFEETGPFLLDFFCFGLFILLTYLFDKKYPKVEHYCSACKKKIGTYANHCCAGERKRQQNRSRSSSASYHDTSGW